MEHRMTPIEEFIRRTTRPRSVINYHPRGHARWDWDIADGWKVDYGLRRRDPIFTPIFIAILGSANVALWAGGPTLATVLSAIATTAVVAGVSYLMAPKPPKPEEMRHPLRQAIPYRLWGVGEARGAGAFMLWESKGDKLISVQAMIAHRINAYLQFYLNDDKVTVTDEIVGGIGKRYDDQRVFISQRLGLVPETPMERITDLLEGEGVWTENHRGDGQASLGMVCRAPEQEKMQTAFPYGPPSLTAVMELALVWDFRDEAQDPEDPETWVFSRNSALILCWHECFNPFGSKRDFRKAILPVLDMWQEEADVCDEDVPLAVGGTEKRYECGGIDSTKNDPKAATNAILASCDGWMCERGDGALLFVAGKFREKYVATITDADVVGYAMQHDVLFEEEINRLVPRFVYPATDYNTTDTDYFEDTAAQLVAGRVLPQEANFDWVLQWRQARRLGKREWTRIQEKKRGKIDLRLTGFNAVYAPWSRLTTPNMIPALNGKVISNRSSNLAVMKGGFQMNFTKMPNTPEDIDIWVPAEDEGAAPPVPVVTSAEDIPEPVIDTIVAITTGSTVILRVAIVEVPDLENTPVIRYRIKDIGGGNPGSWVEQRYPDYEAAAGLIVLDTNPVPTDELLQAQAAFINAKGDYSDWSSPAEEINSTLDTTVPLALVSVTAVGGMGNAVLTITSHNDTHLDAVNIYRVAAGGVLDKNTDPLLTASALRGATFTANIGDMTTANLLTTPDFSGVGAWSLGANWTIGSGVASKTSGGGNSIAQTATITSGINHRYKVNIVSISGSSLTPRLTGGTTVTGTAYTTSGIKYGSLSAVTGNTTYGLIGATATVCSIDDVVLFAETGNCVPQGSYDLHVFAVNRSGIESSTAVVAASIAII